MVTVQYLGRFGNQMFQYALGRCIAEEMGYELQATALPFPRTKEIVEGRCVQYPMQVLEGQRCDLPALLADRSERAIVLNGYFQQIRTYAPYLDRIRGWYRIPPILSEKLTSVGPDDLLIYIRLGDYFTMKIGLAARFYEAVIERAAPRRLFIATEEPEHPFLDGFRKYAPTFLSGTPLEDMLAAQVFRRVAISCSTFSWWAGLLSDAQIYFPIDEDGAWFACNSDQIGEDSIELRLDDPRFVYFYNCPTLKSERAASVLVPLAEVKPQLMSYHRHSQAFWFR